MLKKKKKKKFPSYKGGAELTVSGKDFFWRFYLEQHFSTAGTGPVNGTKKLTRGTKIFTA